MTKKRINRVLFMGSKTLGLKCLKTIYSLDPSSLTGIMTLDDRGDTRGAYDDFRRFASDNNLQLQVVRDRKQSEETIQALNPELCLVVGWYWLISREVLRAVPQGFIGIHNSLLPKYRGGSPLVWAMINGEKNTGFSLFSFTEGMDEGDIWSQCEVEIKETDYIADVLDKIETQAVSLLKERYLKILDGSIKPVPQDHRQATYCASRLPGDGLIDWQKPAKKVYDFIRAQSEPYPGAFTFMDDRKLTIWRARLLDTIYYGTPGQVAQIGKDGIYVICGDNQPLALEVVQLEGEEKHAASEVIKSVKVRF